MEGLDLVPSEPDVPYVDINPLVFVVTGVACCLSLIGAFLLMYSYFKWPELSNRPREILCMLSLADFIAALCYFYGTLRGYKANTWDCVIQSYLSTTASLAATLWSACLTTYLFLVIVCMNRRLADYLMRYYHVLCWGLPVVLVTIVAACGGLGYGGRAVTVGWCWVNVDSRYFLVWMLLSAELWHIACYVLLPLMFLLIIHNTKYQVRMYHELPSEQQRSISYLTQMDSKLHWLPLIYVCLQVWGTLRFFLYVTRSPLIHNQVVLALHGTGASLQGCLHGLVYCFLTKYAREKLLPVLCCLIPPRNTTLGSTNDGDISTNQASESSALIKPSEDASY